MEDRICPICGTTFTPKSSKQRYCNREIAMKCMNCGKEFKTICSKEMRKTCSSKCRAQLNARACKKHFKTCEICGSEFIPKSARQKFCHKPIKKKCEICGSMYDTTCGSQERHTCYNAECENKYAHLMSVNSYKHETRICKWCGKTFVPINNTQIYCTNKHYRQCKNCGKLFEVDLSIYKNDIPKFCSKACRTSYYSGSNCAFSKPEIQEKIKQTNIKKYGVPYPAQSKEIQSRMQKTYYEKTGYTHPQYNPSARAKAAKSIVKNNYVNL